MNLSEESIPDFSDKSVTFYLANVPFEYAVTIDSPKFEIQAGRIFAVGHVVASASNDWSADSIVAIAWDQVSQYLVFDSVEEYKKKVGASTGGFLGLFGR